MKHILTIACCLTLVPVAGVATLTNSPPTAAAALVREALTSNPELRFYEAELAAALAVRKATPRLASPEVSGSLGHKRAREAGGQLAGEGTAWSVSISQTFEWPGRLGLRKAIANHDVTLAELGFDRFKLALAARVRAQAHLLATATEKARVARTVADRYRALREVLVQRDPAGVTPQLELRILEATEVTLRRRATEADLAANDARLALNQLLGRPPDGPLAVDLTDLPLPVAPGLATLLAAAQTNNFELRLRAAELEQQGFRVALAKNERWPSFSVGPQFSEENAGEQERVLGLGISFPLPLWRHNTANVEAARARQVQAETVLEVARRDVERRVVAAARAYETRLSEMAQWRADSVRQFAEAAELADRHYRLAAVPATTYVELQKQYLEAVETLLDTRREAIAAAAELEELTGLHLLDQP
ncbi:MAG TPA: TolC family protein [Methylomirabilota bacterium]|nr:TolC family protein [Methylomirabilota bacterium]